MESDAARTVLLITHAPPRAPDSASQHLQRLGFDLHWVCPARGDRLPNIDRKFAGAILYGGKYAATETRRFPFMALEADWVGDWLNTGRPFLGLGLGAQVLAVTLGARVYSHPDGLSEIGYYTLDPTSEGRSVFPDRMTVAQWHFLGFDTPDATTLLATSGLFETQAFRFAENAFGFQFHPEISMEQHELWLEEEIDMTTIPGAQDVFTQRQLADVYHAPMKAWFERFLSLWVRGAVPESF
jgi:GMP synthase (glutamine-hydrolysing)